MRAWFALVYEMQRVANVESVQAQLDHVLDMLRLCRSDNLGMQFWAPVLMLRLGMDQECYHCEMVGCCNGGFSLRFGKSESAVSGYQGC